MMWFDINRLHRINCRYVEKSWLESFRPLNTLEMEGADAIIASLASGRSVEVLAITTGIPIVGLTR